MDALLAGLILAASIAVVIYAFARRSPVVLVAGGVAVFILCIALYASRGVVVVESRLTDGTLEYVVEPNPVARVYVLLAVLGMFMVVLWALNSLARAWTGRGLI